MSDPMEVIYDRPTQYRIAAIGGGTGLSTLLRGLKNYSENLTAIVTVADDGGGSGKIREDFGILPPGDIRNCILALANAEPVMQQVLQYRFKEGYLKGQSFGNLLIAAMTDLCGGFLLGVKQISNVLAVTGKVLPVSLDNISLCARLKNGTIVEGESRIPMVQQEEKSPIEEVFIKPANAKALPEAIDAINNAQCIVMGPGSLYTSILPNLMLEEVRNAILCSKALKIYIANVMTQPGETTGYTLKDHIDALIRHGGGEKLIDAVIVNNSVPPPSILDRYLNENSVPVLYRQENESIGYAVIEDDLLDYSSGYIRHNPRKLAKKVVELIESGLR